MQSNYQKNYSVSLTYNFAGSGALETQIAQGSPADVFMSADATNNIKLKNASLLANGDTYQTVVYNYVALYVPTGNPKNIQSLSDLLNPGVRVVVAALSVPAGAYTLKVWGNIQSKWGNSSNADFRSSVYANYTKNITTHVVSQTTDVETAIQQVITGAADAGFGYLSDAVPHGTQLILIPIPADVNVKAVYTISVIKSTQHLTEANQFVSFMLSSQGQSILASYGFTTLQSVSASGQSDLFLTVPPLNLTLIGANGTKLTLNASDVAASTPFTSTGGLRTKTGIIENVGSYTGVPIQALLAKVGGLSAGQSVNVTGSDGYTIHYTYQQMMGTGYNTYDSTSGNIVNATQPLTLLVAYEWNEMMLGNSTNGGTGPLRTVLVGPQGLLTDGRLWIKWVVQIQVLNTP